jgi:hypothetical protein
MSWRFACLFSLPILILYTASFFMPAWQDGNGIYTGAETLGKAFDLVARKGDVGTLFPLMLPNLLVVTGMIMLAIPKTWARIVAACVGFFAMFVSAQIMLCVNFLTFLGDLVSAMFGSPPGPSGVREGFFVWISSMFAVMMVGLVTAITGTGGKAVPAELVGSPRRPRYDDESYDDRERRRPREDDDYHYRAPPGRSYDEDDDERFSRRR